MSAPAKVDVGSLTTEIDGLSRQVQELERANARLTSKLDVTSQNLDKETARADTNEKTRKNLEKEVRELGRELAAARGDSASVKYIEESGFTEAAYFEKKAERLEKKIAGLEDELKVKDSVIDSQADANRALINQIDESDKRYRHVSYDYISTTATSEVKHSELQEIATEHERKAAKEVSEAKEDFTKKEKRIKRNAERSAEFNYSTAKTTLETQLEATKTALAKQKRQNKRALAQQKRDSEERIRSLLSKLEIEQGQVTTLSKDNRKLQSRLDRVTKQLDSANASVFRSTQSLAALRKGHKLDIVIPKMAVHNPDKLEMQLSDLESENDELVSQKRTLETDLRKMTEKNEELEEEAAKLRKWKDRMTEELEELNDKIDSETDGRIKAEKELREAQGELKILEVQVRDAQAAPIATGDATAAAKGDGSVSPAEIEALKASFQVEKSKAEQVLFRTRKEYELKLRELTVQLEDEEDAKLLVERKYKSLEHELAVLKDQISSQDTAKKDIDKLNSKLETEFSELQIQLSVSAQEKSILERDIQRLKEDKEELEAIAEEKLSLEQQRIKLRSTIDELQERIDAEIALRKKIELSKKAQNDEIDELRSKMTTAVSDENRKVAEVQLQLVAAKDQVSRMENQELLHKKHIERLEEQLQRSKQSAIGEGDQVSVLERQLDKAKKEQSLAQSEVKRRKRDILKLEDELSTFKDRASKAEARNQEFASKIRTMERDMRAVERKAETEASSRKRLEIQLKGEQRKVNNVINSKDVDNLLKKEIDELSNKLTAEIGKREAAEAERDRLADELAQWKKESAEDIALLKSELQKAHEKADGLADKARTAVEEDFISLEEENAAIKNTVSSLREARTAAEREKAVAEGKIHTLESQIRELKQELADAKFTVPEVDVTETDPKVLAEQLATVNAKLKDALKGRETAEITKDAMKLDLDSANDRVTQLKEAISALESENTDLKEKLANAETVAPAVSESSSPSLSQRVQRPSRARSDSGSVSSPATTRRKAVDPRLIIVKGTRVHGVQVELSATSLTSNDSFILETTDKLYVWNGSTASKEKQAHAKTLAMKLNRKRGADAPELVKLYADTDDKTFWSFFGGKPASIPAGEDDAATQAKWDKETVLYMVDAEKTLVPLEDEISFKILESSRTFILDAGTEMYVWCGKNTGLSMRKISEGLGRDLLGHVDTRPAWVTAQRITEGAEPPLFTEKFADWPDSSEKIQANLPVAAKKKRPDVEDMQKAAPKEDSPLDDASGKVEVWQVSEYVKTPVAAKEYGQFYASQTYIVQYSGKDVNVIYYWIGSTSSSSDQSSAASLSANLKTTIGGDVETIAVEQAKEPAHFLMLFKGKFIVHIGASNDINRSPIALYHVRGTSLQNTRTLQCILPHARLLNGDDVFILNTPKKRYIWIGTNSAPYEKTAAELASSQLVSDDSEEIAEGSENEEFWKILGGKTTYAVPSKSKGKSKFFSTSYVGGIFEVELVDHPAMKDLAPESVAIVDCPEKTFVWVGRKAKEEEQKIALEVADEYAEAKGGEAETRPVVVKDGSEPIEFTRHFQAWEVDPSKVLVKGTSMNIRTVLGEYSKKYTLEELRSKETLPASVDMKKLEDYMRDEDFPVAFKGVSKEEFHKMPQWKKTKLKKEAGLF